MELRNTIVEMNTNADFFELFIEIEKYIDRKNFNLRFTYHFVMNRNVNVELFFYRNLS